MKHWLKQVAVAFDQLVNALLGGWGDETFSARCHRHQDKPGWRWVRRAVDALLFFDKNHCYQSYLSEIVRNQMPSEYRQKE